MSGQQPPDEFGPGNVPRMLPQELLAPTYQNRLRSIGRELDLNNCRSITVLQVDGGFIVRTVRRNDRDIELLQFPDDTFPERMILATEARGAGERGIGPSPLAPTGYEDLLRAVGRWLDVRRAANIAIAEGTSTITVTGDALRSGAPTEFLEARLDLPAIKRLLDIAFRLRGGKPGGEGGL